MALAGGTAWGQQSSIVWEGEELPAEGGEFYLYNKGGGGFLVGGNDYGTHISIGERGILRYTGVRRGGIQGEDLS